ncbi:response regulator transcription factor [Mycoplasmatota bacterium]|nr:response regulator transcription factor [Mycoplasmatota bacterium]
MEQEHLNLIQKVIKHVENAQFEEGLTCFFSNAKWMYKEPNLAKLYHAIKEIPLKYYRYSEQRLILGWLAFASGDNSVLKRLLISEDLNTVQDKTTCAGWYALKSMALFSTDYEKGLSLSKKAINLVDNKADTPMKANIYMSHARQYASLCLFQEAASYFKKAARIFELNECVFLAVSCYTNEALNIHATGNFHEVVRICGYHLRMSSSSRQGHYWELMKLPLGMAYYCLNKTGLSLLNLKSAKKAIDALELPHMHGLVEYYLFNCFMTEKDFEKMGLLVEELERRFGYLEHMMIHLVLLCMKVDYALSLNKEIQREWIDELELKGLEMAKYGHPFAVESLLRAIRMGRGNPLYLDKLKKSYTDNKEKINKEQSQAIAMEFASIYFSKKLIGEGFRYFKEAYKWYQSCGLEIGFFNREIDFLSYIGDIDNRLVKKILKYNKYIISKQNNFNYEHLTTREEEILTEMSRGKTNREIAEVLFISQGTVKWHLANIYKKLNVTHRVEALNKAKEYKIINQ